MIKAYFSPNYSNDENKSCLKNIIKQIKKAKKSILVQAYSFTCDEIANALIDSHNGKIKVEVLADWFNSQSKGSDTERLKEAGISVLYDKKHHIAHNKVIIIDSKTVISGSFNFTKSAECSNAENILIITNKYVTEQYIENWENHKKHCINECFSFSPTEPKYYAVFLERN